MTPFTVPEMIFKGHSSHPLLDRLDFLSETGKVGYIYIKTKPLKWPWKWIKVIGDGTIQYDFPLVVCSNDGILYRFWAIQRRIMACPWNLG